MNKENLRNLLNLNRKVLQYLHWFKGMDFEQPFEIVAGEGSFTSNSLKKAVNVGNDANNYKFSLLLVFNSYGSEKFYAVNIDSYFKFNIDVKRSINYLHSYFNFNIDNFSYKKQFEEVRKSNEVKWFVVMQKKEYIIPAEHLIKTADFTERFTDTDKHSAYIKDVNGVRVANHILDFDKSNYCLNDIHNNYEERARKLRQERNKSKADNYDGLSEAYELKKKIESLLPLITEIINKKDFGKATDIFDRYNGFYGMYKRINDHIEKLENKSYRNVDEIKIAIDLINKRYNTIKNIIGATE